MNYYIDHRESEYIDDEGLKHKVIQIMQVNEDGTEIERGKIDTTLPPEETETTEPVEEPTDEEIIQAEMLLNQQEILINQQSQDEVLAEILLGQQTM